ncbi:hypothetical protein DVH05_026966 [Phytophthora capsici]|nr:hypothetical protein DVH05_026966 [Phytophthora capsici]
MTAAEVTAAAKPKAVKRKLWVSMKSFFRNPRRQPFRSAGSDADTRHERLEKKHRVQ